MRCSEVSAPDLLLLKFAIMSATPLVDWSACFVMLWSKRLDPGHKVALMQAASHYDGKHWCISGVDWGGVEKYVDLTDCYQHYLDPCYVAPKVRIWYLPWTWCYKAQRYAPRTGMFCCHVLPDLPQNMHVCHCLMEGHGGMADLCRKKDASTHSSSHNGSHHMRHTLGKRTNRSMNSSGLDSNFTMLEADRVFGRASEWSGPADLESGLGKRSCQFCPSTTSCL